MSDLYILKILRIEQIKKLKKKKTTLNGIGPINKSTRVDRFRKG